MASCKGRYANLIAGQFQELVSRFVTCSGDEHCGAKTYQASKARTPACDQLWASTDTKIVPSAPRASSQAAKAGNEGEVHL